MDDECRYWGCTNETRSRGDPVYPNSEREWTVGAYEAKFCSLEHELKYEKRTAEGREAKRAAEQNAHEDSRH